MQTDLELLLKLQMIDYDLGELERSKEYLPDMMENLHREMQDVADRLSQVKELLTASRAKQKTLELDIKTKEASLTKYQQQMMSIKTNKEYDALVAEIDSIKASISSNETELLQTIEAISALEKDLAAYQEKDTQIRENNTRQLSILQEKIDSIGEKVAAKEAIRQQVVGTISRPTLSVYERVRRGKGGQVVVLVRKRACGSCYKALTQQRIQEIRRGDKIMTCDNCGCMLYWDNNESN
ncbi:hypothetical protein C3F09_07325 [candidate division GN15 bacterium]|uniref:C4-type zinc ribbon domain-containing protein n=1 Tax=candidate division GN15 bacterium TaxID=2072418 RepID=A0A855X5E7_9BACT|nr:MAG: hypothetical protein C3F09_07325 [candidate division GN15 bacterium]